MFRAAHLIPCYMVYTLNVTCVAKPPAAVRWSLLLSRHEFTVCEKNHFDFSGAVTE
jgi:hypothetical protein